MSIDSDIEKYYDRIAKSYDESRFSNTYGQFIHAQETAILKNWLRGVDPHKTLDVGCGTGRFLPFAENGLDQSPEMLAVARNKYPHKNLSVGDAENTGFPAEHFSAAFSFHVFMHLDKEKSQAILNEMHRILEPGGTFIIDFPSRKRRKLFNNTQTNWHGANEFTLADWKQIVGNRWQLKASRGILFFPVHRLPVGLRRFFRLPDNLWCRSPFKEYASYLVIRLQKK